MEPVYETKLFHVGDVLSITADRLCSPHGMEGVYDILNFMLHADVFTHQIPMGIQICKPELLKQFPQLENVSVEGLTAETLNEWLADKIATYGMYLEVKSLGRVHDQ